MAYKVDDMLATVKAGDGLAFANLWRVFLPPIGGVSSDELNQSGFIVGKESGAEGYAVSAGAGSSSIQVTQTAGTFRRGEKISINGDETVSRTIEKVTTFGINDVYEFVGVNECDK